MAWVANVPCDDVAHPCDDVAPLLVLEVARVTRSEEAPCKCSFLYFIVSGNISESHDSICKNNANIVIERKK